MSQLMRGSRAVFGRVASAASRQQASGKAVAAADRTSTMQTASSTTSLKSVKNSFQSTLASIGSNSKLGSVLSAAKDNASQTKSKISERLSSALSVSLLAEAMLAVYLLLSDGDGG